MTLPNRGPPENYLNSTHRLASQVLNAAFGGTLDADEGVDARIQFHLQEILYTEDIDRCMVAPARLMALVWRSDRRNE